MDPENDDYKIECIVCQRPFKRRSALYRHLRGVHKLTVQFTGRKYKFKCPDPGCSVTFHLSEKLRNHIAEVHDLQIEMCVKRFNTFSEFQKWKDLVQDKTRSLYVSCQNKRDNKNRHFFYTCNRSGGYVTSRSAGKRKTISKKIDGWCPSGMEVKVYHTGGVHVKFWKTHFGHKLEVDRLTLSRRERLIIAKKLKEGLSFEKILDDVRDSVVDADIKRIHLLSRTDIYNISKAFKISNKESLIQKEPTSINSWVESMEVLGDDCPIIFYKEKGAEHDTLKSNDYLLVIMTKMQQKLQEKCVSRVICLDDIKICQSYNYHLITLMTVDEFESGCPLAFGIANKVDEGTICLFLEVISSKAGILPCNIFMSSDLPAFYTAWKKVMGTSNLQLACTWQVDRDFRRALEKLPCSEEKKIRVYKTMRQLMQEADFNEFSPRIEDFFNELEDDVETKRFAVFFRAKYIDRCELWAACYRSQQIMDYSVILEQIHKGLIECYEEGRVMNSFVRTLNLIMGFSRDKMLEKLEKLPKEFQVDNLGNICQIHEQIEEIDVVKTQKISGKQFQVPTVEKDRCYVEHNVDKICSSSCVPICALCSICYHRFTCTCIENFINLNICRHIHASVNMMKNQCNHSWEERTLKRINGNSETFIGDDMAVTREEIVECTEVEELTSETEVESEIPMAVKKIIEGDGKNGLYTEEECAVTTEKMEHKEDEESDMETKEKSEIPTSLEIINDREEEIVNVKDVEIVNVNEEEIINNDEEIINNDEQNIINDEEEIVNNDENIVSGNEEEIINNDEGILNDDEVTIIGEKGILNDEEGIMNDEDEIMNEEEERMNEDEEIFIEEGEIFIGDEGIINDEMCEEEDECDIIDAQSLLLEKVAHIQDMLQMRTFKIKEYQIFDECFNKILEISNNSD